GGWAGRAGAVTAGRPRARRGSTVPAVRRAGRRGRGRGGRARRPARGRGGGGGGGGRTRRRRARCRARRRRVRRRAARGGAPGRRRRAVRLDVVVGRVVPGQVGHEPARGVLVVGRDALLHGVLRRLREV